jgi:hypothetical protein
MVESNLNEYTPTRYSGVVSYKSNVYSGGIGIGAFSYVTIVIDGHSVQCDMFAMNEQQTAHVLGLVVGQPAAITTSGGTCDAQEG